MNRKSRLDQLGITPDVDAGKAHEGNEQHSSRDLDPFLAEKSRRNDGEKYQEFFDRVASEDITKFGFGEGMALKPALVKVTSLMASLLHGVYLANLTMMENAYHGEPGGDDTLLKKAVDMKERMEKAEAFQDGSSEEDKMILAAKLVAQRMTKFTAETITYEAGRLFAVEMIGVSMDEAVDDMKKMREQDEENQKKAIEAMKDIAKKLVDGMTKEEPEIELPPGWTGDIDPTDPTK